MFVHTHPILVTWKHWHWNYKKYKNNCITWRHPSLEKIIQTFKVVTPKQLHINKVFSINYQIQIKHKENKKSLTIAKMQEKYKNNK